MYEEIKGFGGSSEGIFKIEVTVEGFAEEGHKCFSKWCNIFEDLISHME